MCLAAILITSLDQRDKDLLKEVGDGRYFGVAVLNRFGGVPVIRKLQSYKLARQADFDPKYGRARWTLTHCGVQAARLLKDLEQFPLLQQATKDSYNAAIQTCPNTRRSQRPNPIGDDYCTCGF